MGLMEIIISLIIGYFIVIFIKFISFRSRLYAALKALGIPKQIADDIYTYNAERINILHMEKRLSPAKIAQMIKNGEI